MAKTGKGRSEKSGLPPGSLIHIGSRKTEKARITIVDYDRQNFQERGLDSIEQCFGFKDTATVSWINIDGVHQVDIIEKLGSNFELHPLMLEDILNTMQRPKFEDFGAYIYIVLKMLTFDDKKQTLQSEQVSIVLGPNFVISFQESIGDVFDQVRDRLRNAKGRIRMDGCDYLVYSLMDAVVDNYFVVLERLGEQIEALEERLVTEPSEKTVKQIHLLKRELIFLRKSVWPLREVINGLQKSESSLINKATGVYLRDLYDHTIQIIDTIETSRDMVSGMLDIYLSSISNRMNAVMKVLTIIATIFIPLTFIAGVYGMNFKFMPELGWRLGYPLVLLIMAVVAVIMLIYFKRKKWL
jgi:magnesium transporter